MAHRKIAAIYRNTLLKNPLKKLIIKMVGIPPPSEIKVY